MFYKNILYLIEEKPWENPMQVGQTKQMLEWNYAYLLYE